MRFEEAIDQFRRRVAEILADHVVAVQEDYNARLRQYRIDLGRWITDLYRAPLAETWRIDFNHFLDAQESLGYVMRPDQRRKAETWIERRAIQHGLLPRTESRTAPVLTRKLSSDNVGDEPSGPGSAPPSGDTSHSRDPLSGREFDSATDLQYNRERPYEPSTGPRTSQDPIIGLAGGQPGPYERLANAQFMSTGTGGLRIPLLARIILPPAPQVPGSTPTPFIAGMADVALIWGMRYFGLVIGFTPFGGDRYEGRILATLKGDPTVQSAVQRIFKKHATRLLAMPVGSRDTFDETNKIIFTGGITGAILNEGKIKMHAMAKVTLVNGAKHVSIDASVHYVDQIDAYTEAEAIRAGYFEDHTPSWVRWLGKSEIVAGRFLDLVAKPYKIDKAFAQSFDSP